MSRVRLSAVVGLLVVAWFALGSEVLGEALKQAQARSATQVQLHDVVLAIVLTREQAPADLPRGEAAAEARALLEEALEQDRVRAEWPQLAAAALGPELLAVAAAGTDRAPMPRTRAHPHLPPDLLAVEALLAEAHGSWAGEPAAPPGRDLWSGLPPDDQARGLLTLVETRALTTEQARSVQAAVVRALVANDRQPVLVDQLTEALGPAVLARAQASGQAPDPNLVIRRGRHAVEVLRKAERLGP